eukprot:CAMPEP_0204062154 /NCGR_PEP_ID=MMETSP0360-20130528/143664_1 /ASSEMBLY_ACC=CAM_ASM_000342 /TAXON_ID=268821 /ORGANISM="Scrippsiella Hangoei, Strain SHTV-5" /LENGTH=62 /DNA_ID=CAMNT_0051009933 /DNA_START=89 /DNA_END=273 /DNA_ORIENTATION=-
MNPVIHLHGHADLDRLDDGLPEDDSVDRGQAGKEEADAQDQLEGEGAAVSWPALVGPQQHHP